MIDVEHGGGARGQSHRGRAAFEEADALLQHVLGGVHDPGVDVAQLLQGEQVGGVLGALEHIRPGPCRPARREAVVGSGC